MTTITGMGYSETHASSEAGREAARDAVKALDGHTADVVLVFATAGHDQTALLEGVTDVTGDAPMSGCTGEGVISRAGSNEDAHGVDVLAIASDEIGFDTFQVPGLKGASGEAGVDLAEQIRASDVEDPRGLLLFPDGLTVNSTPLLDALQEELPASTTIVGGLAGEMMEMETTYQYLDGDVASDALSAVAIGGDVAVETAVSHGCTPIGLERKVTRARDNTVLEIDGEPAWEVFKEYFDDDPDDLRPQDIVHMCLGEHLDADEAAEYESEYIVRSPLGLEEETGGLVFPAEIPEGTSVQMTRRDPDRIRDQAGRAARSIPARHDGEDPLVVMQFDCAGRGRILFGNRTDEMAMTPVHDAFGSDVPIAGFHCYGEIAPVAGRTRFHNYTVALCALYPK